MNLKRNIISNYFGQTYLIMIGIITVPFYLKYLGAEAYGLVGFFALMQSWMALLDMGMSPTLSREVARIKGAGKDRITEFTKLLHSLEFIFISLALIAAVIIYFISGWLSSNWLNIESLSLKQVALCIKLMGLMIGLRWLSSLYRSGITGSEEQVWLNIANSVILTLKFVCVIFVLHFFSTNIVHFFFYQLLIGIIELFILSTKFYKVTNIGKYHMYFSTDAVKPILPFAMGIAYTGIVWVFLTQLDKLLLSNILPLKEFGYFSIVAMVANAVIQISSPVSKALLPRMTNLLSQGKEAEMLIIYRKSTQVMAIFVFSVVGVISAYNFELLYAWTGNVEASSWAGNILIMYVLGNGILSMAAFQYYLQFAHGKLKMHVLYNTISVIVSVPLIVWSAYTYGAIGVATTWFIFRLVSFIFWTPIVHNRFAPGIHMKWLKNDILPMLISTALYILVIKYFNVVVVGNRGVTFTILLLTGLVLLMLNTFTSSAGRSILVNMVKERQLA